MPPFEQLVDRVSAALWNLYPLWAVRLGKHEYDGVVPDLTAEALADGYDRLGRLREQAAAAAGLSGEQEMDRATLLAVLDGELLGGAVGRRWQRCPAAYLEPLDVGPYLGRDYAPAGLRLEQAAAVLQRAPEVLATARANLDPVIPRAEVGWARRRARALAGALAAGPTLAGRIEPEEQRWLRESAAAAAAAVEEFAAWLDTERLPAAEESRAPGPGLVEQVRVGEGLGSSLSEIVAAAESTLAADRAERMAEGEDGGTPGEVPPASGEEWVAAVREAVGRARRFVAGAAVVTLPEEIPLLVQGESSPAGERVALGAPGPYDSAAAGAVLHAQGRGREAGEADDLAVAAAYPGRLLQSRRLAAAPTEASRRFTSPGCRDGWALYAGQAMWEAGYGGGGPAWRRAWLRRARRAGCRLVGAIAMHAGEMTREQAEGYFMEQGCWDEQAARDEVERAVADPRSWSAGLGRVEILDLRRRWEVRFPEASLAVFHDALLSRGAPPLGLLERVVLP